MAEDQAAPQASLWAAEFFFSSQGPACKQKAADSIVGETCEGQHEGGGSHAKQGSKDKSSFVTTKPLLLRSC